MVNRRRPSRETPLGPGAKKDGCFRRLCTTKEKVNPDGVVPVSSTERPVTPWKLKPGYKQQMNLWLYVISEKQIISYYCGKKNNRQVKKICLKCLMVTIYVTRLLREL